MDTEHDLLPRLAGLVVKDHVSLGGLAPAQLSLALGLVWAGLPAPAVLSEPEINVQLKAQLAGPACWLATDHVELRRWLVDAGWLRRDGFGREYLPTGRADLDGAKMRLADALAGIDTHSWVMQHRAARAAARESRRREWEAGQAAQAGSASTLANPSTVADR